MGSAGMKRSTRAPGDTILRSGRRLFASRYEEEVKRMRLTPVAVMDTQKNKVELLDHEEQERETKLSEFKKLNRNGTDEVMRVDQEKRKEIKVNSNGTDEQGEIKSGESKKTSLVNENHNASRTKQFGAVYTRKRKRIISSDSSLNSSMEEKRGSDKMFKNKYFTKRVRNILKRQEIYRDIIFSAIFQESTCTKSHGFLKVFGSVLSVPFFTVDFTSLPFCFLYIHSSLLLKFAFLSYILHPIIEHIMDDNVKVPSIVTRLHHFGKFVVATKARSTKKRVPRISLFKKAGYEQEEYIPFRLPELYICSRSDEVSRTLQKNYPIYDMDSDDENWLKKFNERFGVNEFVSEDTFEKVIDAFERGGYCSPNDHFDATSAVDRCLGLASKKVLEAVYRYWMTKRKKKRSPLVRVFQCFRRVRNPAKKAVLRKKRSFRRRKSQRRAGIQVDFIKAMMNEQKALEEATKAYMDLHETEEDARRVEVAAIVKRQEAQTLMETADLAIYRATMALRFAEVQAPTSCFLGG